MSQNPSAFAPDAALPAPADEPAAHASPNQFALLRQRRFAPFFWTQFAGAANDNLFKFAFTVMVTYQLSVGWLPPAMAGLVIGALFILPFLLFSATSGQLTDKYDKTTMIRLVKNLEIGIMALAAWAFMAANVPVLLGCVFLMGLQRVAQDFAQQHQMDQKLKDADREGYTLLLGMRSWEFEAFTRLRR